MFFQPVDLYQTAVFYIHYNMVPQRDRAVNHKDIASIFYQSYISVGMPLKLLSQWVTASEECIAKYFKRRLYKNLVCKRYFVNIFIFIYNSIALHHYHLVTKMFCVCVCVKYICIARALFLNKIRRVVVRDIFISVHRVGSQQQQFLSLIATHQLN